MSSDAPDHCIPRFPATKYPRFTIRPARPEDAELLMTLVGELAVYEKLEHAVRATPEDLRNHLFGSHPAAEAAVAEVDGDPAGFAIWYATFSTFRGQPGLYVEDIFVRPKYRGLGIGKAIIAGLSKQALALGYGRVEWSVLNWNEPAIGFYRSLGARAMDEWTVYRIDDEPLEHLAEHVPKA
jgi:GNAT superfamily N-acetyltransferase